MATKFGLTEPQREQLFDELLQSVYQFGMTDACRQQWQQIQKKYSVDNSATEQILEEGFNGHNNWRNPQFPNLQSRLNFKAWNAERFKTGRDPLLSN